MLADVIVDVKVKQLNRPFTYTVPERFLDLVEVGMRVIVPFGERQIMGYIIALRESGAASFELKPITNLIDLTPVLTPELLDLAKQLAHDTASFLVSCIQAMLPVAIKAQYRKKLIKKGKLEGELNSYFNKKDEILYEDIKPKDLVYVKRALEAERLELKYEIRDKTAIKVSTYVQLTEQIGNFNPKAKKQVEVVNYLLKINQPILKTELFERLKLSHTTYKRLLELGGIQEISAEEYRDPYQHLTKKETKQNLNPDQERAYEQIIAALNQDQTFLLHGITGSGKTEVYLHVIETVIQSGKEAILLVPEIALTPQIVRQFKARFGDDVAVLHSGLSNGEKYDEWRKIRQKKVKVAVGARSAIFAPFTNLGIIIIDEEHEGTYKQTDMPRYHAVEVAKMRAKSHQAVLVLGSATPSLESYARAVKGVYKLLELPNRATNMDLPETQIIDMTNEFKQGNLSIVSAALQAKILERVARNEQVILLLNRRGYENFLLCRSCGYTIMCQNCDVSLTYHKQHSRLRCHYCGYEQLPPKHCPKCGSEHLRGFGYGTEKVEEELHRLFPGAGVLRMDNDTTSTKGEHERILTAFRNHEAHILLGTQMIAKGLDFPDVTLVGVLLADTNLKLPDFRASEKTFQLLVQVAGRAGRHRGGSEVLIQTYNPSHYAIVLAAKQNYRAFFNHEMQLRKLGRYVPYYYMAQLIVKSDAFQLAYQKADQIKHYLQSELTGEQTIILGPVVPFMKRIKNVYQVQLILKYKNETKIKDLMDQILVSYQSQDVDVIIDLNPNFLL